MSESKEPWTHWVQPNGERHTQESLAALALEYFRSYRNDSVPGDLPPDGSRGQYGAFTESMIAALTTPREDCLIRGECDTDFDLSENYTSCWVAVDDVSVYIRRGDDGVHVDMYANHCEEQEPLDTAYAAFGEAKDIQDHLKRE